MRNEAECRTYRPTALFVDRGGAALTAAWTRALSEAGVPTSAVHVQSPGSEHTWSRAMRVASGGEMVPVTIGIGEEAMVAFRVLLAGHAAGSILIDPEVPPTEQPHGPLLMLVGRPKRSLAALQVGGTCDQLIEPRVAHQTDDDYIRELAEYIHGWLQFHQLCRAAPARP